MARIDGKVGIIGWGVYIPRYRIKMEEFYKVWGFDESIPASLNMYEKAIAGPDEDTITIGYEAALNALRRADIDPSQIEAVFVGTESKPYAVKPSATVIAEALGITPKTTAIDMEFACRAGSEGIRNGIGLVMSGMAKYVLAVGADTAQANPGDVLEFTASSGGAAYIIGPGSEAVAVFEGVYTYVTDTPDFWRRELSPYPQHGEGFTGEPAYFYHIINAVGGLMEELGLTVNDFDYAVFHQPNGVFPLRAAKKLGIPKEKVIPGLVTPWIGNTYNGSALIGLAKVLDEVAKPGDRILVAPFGSGAGADAYSIVVKEKIIDVRNKAPTVKQYIERKTYISYAQYAKFRNLIKRIPEA